MYMEVQVADGRRVRHPKTRKVLMRDRWYRVKWGPVWARKEKAGDIHTRQPEVSE